MVLYSGKGKIRTNANVSTEKGSDLNAGGKKKNGRAPRRRGVRNCEAAGIRGEL